MSRWDYKVTGDEKMQKKVSNNQSINYQGEKCSLANPAIAGLLTLANVCCPLTE